MSNTMEYKGYLGSVEFSEGDALFFGKVLGLRALLSYEGENARELVENFHGTIDDYLALCTAEGIEPERAYQGNLRVQISPDLHRKAALTAAARQMSLNTFVERSIQQAVLSGS